MRYRPFNRALGQTSLELKCLFLFGLFLAVVVTINFLLYWWVAKSLVNAQNPADGRLLVDRAMLIMHQNIRGDGTVGKPSPFLEQLSRKLPQRKQEARFIVPARFKKPSKAPTNKREEELLAKYLRATPDDQAEGDGIEAEGRLSEDGEEYHYYQAVRADHEDCVDCHRALMSGQDVPLAEELELPVEGDLLAIAQVSISQELAQKEIASAWAWLLGVAIITAFLSLSAFYVVIRYVIVHPLRHLHDVSDAISHGDIAMRADIHTGDEFEWLGVAFNRMLSHMVAAQDELHLVNRSLDGKVDELAQLNMQLYEMNRIKSDFMATMSHELRTPLNSILGFSDVLGSIDSLDDKQRRYVNNIQKSGRTLLDMINNVLDLARLESGKLELHPSEFNIAQIVSAQCDMARPLTEKKNIDLVEEVASNLPPMRQDQPRVQQIVTNLLSNAIKFTPEGGRIRVTAERTDREELLLKVIDTGVGIAEEDQQIIFEKFRQGQTATPGGDAITREYPGSGLGLSIVKELCRLLDGEITVQSELGTGSEFLVRLPWELEDKPLLDSPLAQGLDDMVKPRPRLTHDVGDSIASDTA